MMAKIAILSRYQVVRFTCATIIIGFTLTNFIIDATNAQNREIKHDPA